MKSRSFVDTAVLHAVAGKGGDGSRSFRHEKFVPKGGPDGGDGGRGGSVWLVGDEDVDSLVAIYYEPERRAPAGGAGMGRYRHGANGADLFVKVPLGTVVSDAETGRDRWINTGSATVRRNYETWNREAAENMLSTLRRYRIDTVTIGTGEDYVKQLIAFFKNRA